MGDYAVLIGRRTGTLIGLPPSALQAEFGLLGRLAIRQVRDILDALIEHSETKARHVAARDDEIDSLYHKVFDELISDLSSSQDPDAALRAVTLIRMAHHLERIGDRVTNVAEDIVFLESGEVVELG
jgi:phosphate transport system protein